MAKGKNRKKGRSLPKKEIRPQSSAAGKTTTQEAATDICPNAIEDTETTNNEGSGIKNLPQETGDSKTPECDEIKVQNNTDVQARSVGIVTCAAGMFLSLILGIYIGTLVPDILQKKEREAITQSAPHSSAEMASVMQQKSQAMNESSKLEKQTGEKVEIPQIPQQIAERIAHLREESKQKADDANIWIELGNLYFDVGQVHQSIHAYEHALGIKPANPDVLTDLGIMYRESGDFNKAVECFRKASAIKPDHVNALFNEGVVLATDLRNNQEAAKAWKKLLDIDPEMLAPDGKPIKEILGNLR